MKIADSRPGRGMVLIEVLPEDTRVGGIAVAYAKSVSANGVVIAVGAADIMGEVVVSVGDRVYVPTSGVEQIEEDGKTYAVVHHGKIRLYWSGSGIPNNWQGHCSNDVREGKRCEVRCDKPECGW